jgi:FOG: TPR repeat, SEL1 subfamily
MLKLSEAEGDKMSKILRILVVFLFINVVVFQQVKFAQASFPSSLQKYDANRPGGLAVDLGWYEFKIPEEINSGHKLSPKELEDIMKFANEGDAKSQFQLGTIYYTGSQITQDYRAAFTWYELAAKQNHPLALNALGELYARGLGTKPDYAKALSCFQAAAKKNVVTALFNLGYIYSTGSYGQKINRDEGIYYYLQSANLGYIPAMLAIGGLKRKSGDMLEAYKWLYLAEKYSDVKIADKEGMLACATSLTKGQKGEAEKWAETWKPKLFAHLGESKKLNGVWTYSFMPYRSQVYKFTIELKEENGKILGHYKVLIERFLKDNTVLAAPNILQTKNKMYGLTGKRSKDGNVVLNWYDYNYPCVKGTAIVKTGAGQTLLWTTTVSNDYKRMVLPQVQKVVTMVKTDSELVVDCQL